MVININDIPPEGLTLDLKLELDLFGKGSVLTACTAELTVRPAGVRTYRVAGRVKAVPELECSRCLERFGFSVDSAWEIDLVPKTSLGAEQERELVSGELDTEFYEGDAIDTADLVREQVLIAIPMVPLHREDCKGLCGVCGADLNKTACGHEQNKPDDFGAFSALKELFQKKKEQ